MLHALLLRTGTGVRILEHTLLHWYALVTHWPERKTNLQKPKGIFTNPSVVQSAQAQFRPPGLDYLCFGVLG